MKIDDIIIPDYRIRDHKDISLLQKSMAILGQLQPILVSKKVLVAGYGRLLAAKALGWSDINAIELSELTDEQMLAVEFEENATRKPMTWQEIANGLKRLLAIHGSVEAVAHHVAMSAKKVQRYIDVANAAVDRPYLWECATLREASETPLSDIDVDIGEPERPRTLAEFFASKRADLVTHLHARFGSTHLDEYLNLFLNVRENLMAKNSIAIFWVETVAEMFKVALALQRVGYVHKHPLIEAHSIRTAREPHTFDNYCSFGVVCSFGEPQPIGDIVNFHVNPDGKTPHNFYSLMMDNYRYHCLHIDYFHYEDDNIESFVLS